jgi:putative ABC transport system ATP-binding protein
MLEMEQVTKIYGRGPRAVTALDGLTTAFAARRFAAVMGPSGSGKTTLLQCAAGIERPSSGRVRIAGQDLSRLSESGLAKHRRRQIGFVFQQFNLVGALTAAQNVALPLVLDGHRPKRATVQEVLAVVALADRARHRPTELSGGQRQRVAIARALIGDPAVIFADEPTGALDSAAARNVLELLRRIVNQLGRTVVMVTHDSVAASYADTVLFLRDGGQAGTLEHPSAEQIAERLMELERRC